MENKDTLELLTKLKDKFELSDDNLNIVSSGTDNPTVDDVLKLFDRVISIPGLFHETFGSLEDLHIKIYKNTFSMMSELDLYKTFLLLQAVNNGIFTENNMPIIMDEFKKILKKYIKI